MGTNPDSVLHRFEHETMATTFEVFIPGQPAHYARYAANMLFDEFDRLNGLLSRFDACSDVGRINALRPGETIPVSNDVLECLMLATKIWQDTGGAFDVTAGAMADIWRDSEGRLRSPSTAELGQARQRQGLDRLVLNPNDFTVGLDRSSPCGITVDLGGIGKGYALDKIEDLLLDWEIENELVNGGASTVLAIGPGVPVGDASANDAGKGWKVGIGGDWGPAAGIDSIYLRDTALSGSGPELKGEHIVDPRTGRPDRQHEAAWAVCPSATVADALSTAFMVMRTEAVRAYCEANPPVEAYVVPRGGGLMHLP